MIALFLASAIVAQADAPTCRAPDGLWPLSPEAVERSDGREGVWFENQEAERVLFLLNCVPALNATVDDLEETVDTQGKLINNLRLQVSTATASAELSRIRGNEWRELYREEVKGKKLKRTLRDVGLFLLGAGAVGVGAWAVSR